ncbi:FHA domain-containing protein [Cyanobacterium stanieri PCC 7202]|uniref:FHA domain-containing protein n=1 Tax=Cyanobacterium stanieri (strain ATCC 29140 / PCC 7202) TaxID=292563 RepID=K9YLH6_CYASC|nr:FHA domain-containing protein [Cyanobacterium stanieri PCC 7202]
MVIKKILSCLVIFALSIMISSCSDTIDSVQAFNTNNAPIPKVDNIAEVAPPKLIQELNKTFLSKQPQVSIISPANDEILSTTTAEVKLAIKGLDIFKNEELQMGPHLHFFLDDQPYQAVYNTDEPLRLSDLAPGTHTIRVFASRPWHESFKNSEAYAQTTFHVFTPTEDNNPSGSQPLLTYSRPQGNYGAEPIMLDFYLTNAPLHLVAQESQEDSIRDWRIRVTVNGETFLLDTWQPIYLTGFNKGENWVKLEFIDDRGDVIKNSFNSTVRVINYDPKIKDTLSKLVMGKISLNKAKAITIPTYRLPPEPVVEDVIEEEEVEVTEGETTSDEAISEEIVEEEETTVTEVNPVVEEEKTDITPEEKTDEDVVNDIIDEILKEDSEVSQEEENKSLEEIITEEIMDVPPTNSEESTAMDIEEMVN